MESGSVERQIREIGQRRTEVWAAESGSLGHQVPECAERSHRQIDLAADAWDKGHDDIVGGHKRLGDSCDQGIAALPKDLQRHGLPDETLVPWGGEFGRAPTAEGVKGRDHNHHGFTTWMAGGGVKGGMSFASTDNFGMRAGEPRPRSRSARHRAASHWPGPREARVPLQRTRLPPHRRLGARDPGHHRVIFTGPSRDRGKR